MDIDYANLEHHILDGTFRQRLEQELLAGFREIHESGERLPVASHYASQIAEIVNHGLDLSEHLKYELYQEILEACENARAMALGGE